jgi:peptidoglycan/xylan/chitin deacetylase (PgdA/CDA1 family)
MKWREPLRRFASEYANWDGLKTVCLTFDVDFAPDYMLDHVLTILARADVPATFYATHHSEVLRELAAVGKHEVGLHPYTGPATTQGENLEAIVDDLRRSYPEAVGTRFHVLHHSYRDLLTLGRLGLQYDVSTLRFGTPYLLPAHHRDLGLVLLTYSWEDGISENAGIPLRLETLDVESPGLKIFNFHPMNVFINGSNSEARLTFMAENPDLLNCPREVAEQHRRKDAGAESLLEALLEHLTLRGCRLVCAAEVAAAYKTALESELAVWEERR